MQARAERDEPAGNSDKDVPHDSKDAPGGAAQFDPAQQTRREDVDEADRNGEGQEMRGNLPPGAERIPPTKEGTDAKPNRSPRK